VSALGIDVGGTFTDAVLVGPDGMVTAKVLSTAQQEDGDNDRHDGDGERTRKRVNAFVHANIGDPAALDPRLARRLDRSDALIQVGIQLRGGGAGGSW